jgi:hypothetical protein
MSNNKKSIACATRHKITEEEKRKLPSDVMKHIFEQIDIDKVCVEWVTKSKDNFRVTKCTKCKCGVDYLEAKEPHFLTFYLNWEHEKIFYDSNYQIFENNIIDAFKSYIEENFVNLYIVNFGFKPVCKCGCNSYHFFLLFAKRID